MFFEERSLGRNLSAMGLPKPIVTTCRRIDGLHFFAKYFEPEGVLVSRRFGRSDLAQSTSLAKIHVRMGSFTGSDSGRLPQYRMTNARTKRRNSGSNRRRGSCNMMFAGRQAGRFCAGRPVGKRIHHRDDLDVSLGRLLDEVVCCASR